MLQRWFKNTSLGGPYFGKVGESALSRNEARQRAFVSAHVASGGLALVVLPFYILMIGWPQTTELLALLWLSSPILIGFLLKRTGHLKLCHILSAANMTGLISYLAFLTGGASSFLAAWFIAIPAEAALSGSRRVIYTSVSFVLLGVCVLWFIGALGILPPSRVDIGNAPATAAICLVLATLYAASMAIYSQHFSHLAEGQADAEEARYRFVARHTRDTVLSLSMKGTIAFVSANAKNMFGLAADVLTHAPLRDFIHDDDRPSYLRSLQAAKNAESVSPLELRLISRDTKPVWIEMSLCRLDTPDINGHLQPTLVAVLRDIDERKHQERALVHAHEAARAASRAKSRFLAGMSHELRTPLNAIIGFSDIIKHEMLGAVGVERYRDYARLISDSGARLLGLISDVLDMANLETGRYVLTPEWIAVPELVANVSADLQVLAEARHIKLTSNIAPESPLLEADKRATRQILANLLKNAIQVSPDNGEVMLDLHVEDQEMSFTIQDRGPGMAADLIARLGQPFETAGDDHHRSAGTDSGSGLGFALARSLAELHGGHLHIMSALGKGTKIEVRLPLRCRPANRQSDKENGAQNAA